MATNTQMSLLAAGLGLLLLLASVGVVVHRKQGAADVQMVSTRQEGAAEAGRYRLKRRSTGALSMFAIGEANKARGSLWKEISEQQAEANNAAPYHETNASISSLPVFFKEEEPTTYLDVAPAPAVAHRGSVQVRSLLSPVRHASILEEEEPEEADDYLQFVTTDTEVATSITSATNLVVYDDETPSHLAEAPSRPILRHTGEDMFNEQRLKHNLKSSERLF